MEMQNITLSLPKSTLRKIKLIAVQRETSVSKLVTEQLEKIASENSEYIQARDRQLAILEKGFDLGFEKPTSRDELYDRKV
jgi:hypothetical protein